MNKPALLAGLRRVVGEDFVRTDEDSLAHFGRDTCDLFEPAPSAVVFPDSTQQVRDLVLLANDQALALVPSGGRTGLSGGATATRGEIVVSMERMNAVIGSNPGDRTIECQAGVITAQVHAQAESMGLFYPVDFAASGSSHIGGNVATNAGGVRVIRYGMTRNWVAGLQVVTGAGEILELGKGLVKDNTGYDLRHLMTGSEGTLGIITGATMRLASAPGDAAVMVLGAEQMELLLPVLERFGSAVTVNAFEFFSEQALQQVIEKHRLQRPFETPAPVYALIEFEQANDGDVDAAMNAFEQCVADSLLVDGVISQSSSQAHALWRLREDISATLAHRQPYKNDLSVRVSAVPQFLAGVEAFIEQNYSGFEVLCYGHIGDGNVHLNILRPHGMGLEAFKKTCASISEGLFEMVQRFGGSVSAEHGVGLLKKESLHYSRSAHELELMRSIKRAFDPAGVLNPGKIFD